MTKKKFSIKFVAFFSGCYSCFLLHHFFFVNVVVASCLIGLIGTFLPLKKVGNEKNIQAAIYAGSFAGMCSAGILTGPLEILALSILGASFFILTENILHGLGGKLGTIAFTSVTLVYLIKEIF